MTQIIAFVGFKQVGKTTASQYLIEKHGFVKHSFKDALIAEVKEKFPDLLLEMLKFEMSYTALRNRQTYIDSIDGLFIHKPPLIRALMQNYGTEVRRGDDPDYWVNKWYTNEGSVKTDTGYIWAGPHRNTVVDDVRFLNEAKAVKSFGGTIIRLTRPDITSGGDHSSETEQLQIEADYTIECEPGNHEKLYTALDKIVS